MRAPWLLPLSLLSALALAVTTARAGGIQSLYSRDGTDVWAVGDSGVVYRSLDGGARWTSSALGDKALRGVAARGFNVLVVGDSGKVWHSQDSGGAWALSVLPGVPNLFAIDMPSDSIGYIVGSHGAILETSDGGNSWTAEVSGTVANLNALRFSDDLDGWAVGDGGTALRTTDGGVHWNAIAAGAAQALQAVDVDGPHVWVVGVGGLALRSDDGGASWIPLQLKLDTPVDVKTVWLQSADSVYIAGGGGFIRRSYDRGATWEFLQHPMQAQISDVFFVGARGWAASNRNRSVMSTLDRGTTWSLPGGTTVTRSWDQRLPGGSVRGSTIGLSSTFGNTIYCAMGATIFRSLDEGETWSTAASIPGNGAFNAFLVSPTDSNVMVAAVVGNKRQLVKTTNGGQSWTATLTHAFGEYGIPLAMDPDRPATIYFGGDSDNLFRSTDQGSTWVRISNITFRSPCDILAVPDSDNIILVGDGVTNSGDAKYYKSSDGGVTFTLPSTQPVNTSEIPGLATCRLRNSVIFGTDWGGGGVQRSPDYGSTWPNVSGILWAWGVDVCKDDPNVVVFGLFGSGASGTYLSLDGGNTFSSLPLTGYNFSFYARDREVIFAEQNSGIWKMRIQYNDVPNNTQLLTVTAPNGGEVWAGGSVQTITWMSENVAVARVEYRPMPTAAWQTLADVPGYQNTFRWTVPADATTEAEVRVRDGWDSAPADSSDAPFTITVPSAIGERTPMSFEVRQNHPNPFGRRTEIRYALPSRSTVSLEVFDLQGQRVARLLRGEQGPGEYAMSFGTGIVTDDGARVEALSTGVYFYRFRAGAYTRTRKMLLLK